MKNMKSNIEKSEKLIKDAFENSTLDERIDMMINSINNHPKTYVRGFLIDIVKNLCKSSWNKMSLQTQERVTLVIFNI